MKEENENHQSESGEHVFHHQFDNLEELVKRFDPAERDAWQMPEKIIELLNLPDQATAAEIGAGTGYFAVRIAGHLKNGKVIALDREPQLVAYLKDRAKDSGLTNVEARLAEIGGVLNLSETVDLVISIDVYHHLPDRAAYFSKLTGYLKPNGKLVVIDRRPDSPGSQPNNRVAPETVQSELQTAGFRLTAEFDFLPYQYYLVFEAGAAL